MSRQSRAVGVPSQILDWPAAAAAVAAAAAHAQALGLRINVAVVDASGLQVAFLRMPGAPLHSIDISVDKAYTAASFGLSTGRWHEALAQHSAAVREGLVRRPRFVGFGGGLPLVHQGQLIGGIGVSGASEAEDEACAQAGLDAMGLET